MGWGTTRPEAALGADLACGKNPLAKTGDVGESLPAKALSPSGPAGMQPPASGGLLLVLLVFRSDVITERAR